MDPNTHPKLSLSHLMLSRQMYELTKCPSQNFSVGLVDEHNVYRWQVLIIGPTDTIVEGGFFRAHIEFPVEYPGRPPHIYFLTDMWHPNIDRFGNVYLPMLNENGDDRSGAAAEPLTSRWMPVHSVENIIEAVVKLLCEPNLKSATNREARQQYRHAFSAYKQRVLRCIRKSQDYKDYDN